MTETRKPTIGEILLFKIDPADFGIWRPLLVTFIHDDNSVDGELFLCWERDRRAEWPVKYLFWGLDPHKRTFEVRGVAPGDAVGNYHFKPLPLEDRVAALEAKARPVGAPPRPLTPEKRTK